MGKDVSDGNLVVEEIIKNACAMFLDGKLAQMTKPYGQAADPTVYTMALLASGVTATWALKYVREDAPIDGLQVPWEVYVKSGVHPVEAMRRQMPIIVRLSSDGGEPNELLGHPLNVAMMFAKFMDDKASAEQCVVAHKQIREAIANGQPHHYDPAVAQQNPWENPKLYRYGDRYRFFKFWTDSWVCPDPRKYGLEDLLLESSPTDVFSAYPLFAWYTKEAARTAAKDHAWGSVDGLERVARAMRVAGIDHVQEVLSDVAAEMLKSRWEDTRPEYAHLALLLRLSPKEMASSYVDKATGTKAVLGICLNGATRGQMGAGLSALAQQSSDYVAYLSKLYGRAPLVSELCALRAKKLVDILYYMPSSLLKEVLEEDEAAERLRARLLREVQTSDPTKLRAALIEHDKRASLTPYATVGSENAPIVDVWSESRDTEWDVIFGELAHRYTAAIAFRARLSSLIRDQTTRVAALVAMSDKSAPMLKMLQLLPNWEEVDALIKNFAFLLTPTRAEVRPGR